MNLLQNQIKCIECGSTKLIKDFEKKEIYCSKCGLIVLDTSIPTLKQKQQLALKNEVKTKSKKLQRIAHTRWENFLYNFL